MLKGKWSSIACLTLVTGAAIGCERQSSLEPIPSETASATAAAREFSDAAALVGCGVVTILRNGDAQLSSVPRRQLPAKLQLDNESRRTRAGAPVYRIVGGIELTADDGEKRQAICAVPINAPLSVEQDLKQSLNLRGEHSAVVVVTASVIKREQRKLLEEALWLPLSTKGFVAKRYGKVEPTNATSSFSAGKMRTSTIGARFSSYPIAGIVISATSLGNSGVYYDFRQLESMIASFWKYGSNVDVVWNGYEVPDCAAESSMFFELDELANEIQQAIDAISSGAAPGANVAATNYCPDSLMQAGDTCADVYIAAPKHLGFIVGNGRGPDPYANVSQSKFQFIPHFNSGTATLLVSGSEVRVDIPLPSGQGGWTTTPIVNWYVPSNPWQVEKLQIDAPTLDRRVVTLKVVNADCGMATGLLSSRFPGQEGTAWFGLAVDAACPAIDMTITYDRNGANWHPNYVVRDAYPTLDIFEKLASGQFQLIHHSEESNIGALLGLQQLKEKINHEKDELLQDPTCQLQ